MLAAMVLSLLLPAAAPSARAARGNATVAAGLSDSSVDAGDQTQYQISVTNGDLDGPPRTPAVDGLTINYAGRSSSTQYVLGNDGFTQSTTTTYVYTVETNKPGRYTIPGQEVRTDGGVLRTLPVTLTVLGQAGANGAAGDTPRVYAEIVAAKKIAYVGEAVPVEVRAFYAVNINHDVATDLSFNGEGFSVQKFVLPRMNSQSTRDGRYTADVYKSSVAGLKLGLLTLGPATLDPLVQFPRAGARQRTYNDPLDRLFNGQFDPYNMGPPRRIKVQSEPVALEIRPLPEAGKPEHFSGAIGQFKLTAEAVPNKAQTGDPVTIRLRLSGQGNFDRITPPALVDDAGLRTYPPTTKFKADDEVGLSGVQTIEQVVIAEGPRTTLPSYRFNYLDLATGKYVSVDTPPLSVKIEGRNLATPTPAPAAPAVAGTPGASATPTPAPTPRRAPEDILYIRADAGPERDREAFLPAYRRTGFWVVQGGILAAVLALGGTVVWRARRADEANRRAAVLARQQGDLQRALRREDTGRREFYTAATRLAQLRVGAEDASLSAAEIARAKGLDPTLAGSVREIFARHEELAYSGAAAAESPVPDAERRDVLATLETIGRN